MGKSVVLKDSLNRPAGYMRAAGDCVICRAQLEEPSQLALVFADGSQSEHTLSGRDEQRFSCEGNRVTGCYVFRGNELLLVSCDAMRGVFARQMHGKNTTTPEREQTDAKEKAAFITGEPRFAQRRWPPPPCFQAAYYRDGRWQEE